MKTMHLQWSIRLTGLLCSLSGTLLYAEEMNKSRYHLFPLTPRHQMRELSTDRPDKTESPYTVDAGHVQIELDRISFAFEKEDGYNRRTADVMAANVKFGLANSHDLQILLPLFSGESQWADADINPSQSPILNELEVMTVRWKWNLVGNDQGDIAFAVMPWVEILYDDADQISTGIILPCGFPLFSNFSTAAMIEVDRIAIGSSEYEHHLIVSGTVGRDLSASWGAYAELFTDIEEDVPPISTSILELRLAFHHRYSLIQA